MKAYDYEAVEYMGEILCVECLPNGYDYDEVEPIFADTEWDTYPVCDHCGETHDYVGLVR